MMIPISFLIYLCFVHWIADFVCQTDWMARNKSKNNKALLVHITMYSFVLGFYLSFYPDLFGIKLLYFVVLNGFLHFCIDWVTSRITSHLHSKGQLGSTTIPNLGFFSFIGLDQFLHMASLFITYGLIFL